MNANAAEQDKRSRQERKAERKRVKKLERGLRRKDKALAVTAALLTLSKKTEAIWGRNDEDDWPASWIASTPSPWSNRPSATVPGWPKPATSWA
ncbi:MAG: hypothetical protein JJT90_11175 [Ectothiorhodospiraceae bacterium]|nr:hypothetical protein [Ectothiorhodospiraceae bacterium]